MHLYMCVTYVPMHIYYTHTHVYINDYNAEAVNGGDLGSSNYTLFGLETY